MKNLLWVCVLVLGQIQMSQAFASFEIMKCKGTGAIDGIEELFFQESDLEGQVCGYLLTKQKNYTCFNGSLFGERMEILSVPAESGTYELQITQDSKDQSYILSKYLVQKSKKELVAEERIQCEFGVLKH